MPDPSKCVFDDFGGKTHPYGYCVKDTDEMIDGVDPDKWGFASMGPPMKGILNYTTSLIVDPSNAISQDCSGKLGNRYLMKTKRNCSNGKPLHRYVDNISAYMFGRPSEKLGFLPAAVSSATKINPIGIFNAITGEIDPSCVELRLNCHVIHGNDTASNYSGWSNPVWIPEDEARQISQTLKTEAFQIIDGSILNHESIHDYIKNNPDLLIRNRLNKDSDINFKFNSKSDLEQTLRNNEDIIVNIYYLLLSILLLYIVYKLVHKK